MIMNKKGITPIISVILLLMMSVAVAGIAWFWLQSMTQKVMSQTEQGTNAQLTALANSLQVQGSPVCNATNGDVSAVIYNPSTASVSIGANAAIGSSIGTVTPSSIGAGTAAQVVVNSTSAVATGLQMVTLNAVGGGSVTFGVNCA
jgi:flagellin-like protein